MQNEREMREQKRAAVEVAFQEGLPPQVRGRVKYTVRVTTKGHILVRIRGIVDAPAKEERVTLP